jgi:hypothetical protein
MNISVGFFEQKLHFSVIVAEDLAEGDFKTAVNCYDLSVALY